MDLTYLRTFREVARRQSFTRAAEELGYAQSSITMQIQKLEKEYGVSLIERYGRQLRLTPPGEELLKLAVQMLDLYDQSKEQIANQIGGSIIIGTIDSLAAYYLPRYLQQLKQQIVGLTVQLLPESESVLLTKVRDGEFDVGLLLDRYPADPTLHCISIREEPLVLIAPPAHPLTKQAHVRIQDLDDIELIVSEESCIYRGIFEKLLKDHGIQFRIGFELGSLEAIKQCVANGLGIALMPLIAAQEEVNRGSIAIVPFAHEALRFELQLIIHPKKWMSQALLAFIKMLTGESLNASKE
ncbi:LysR family transcriptional regulator [Paenibacillus radicis (ex Xue et al. 2023)]|uniref:LysR family transcriptional regulator n=1 Tax=Paenibacillus radicis (ex Xue et al. 2023) TaxID=2972489 RepID=A0ABT1YLG4_9BACL|nr:LysR family transcriptional regulator [Paenibacillus radicis (ex Xue et al. 2023)]MCR8634024.1 LysR family transcriptional regulator [Paenibacillus radicis (ex Xue et al. 2023)]